MSNVTTAETDSAVTTGLRARKKRETRERISAVALERFARDGFAETTVRDIASDAGVAPRTFFHYFDTKEDVVLADFMGRLARLLEDLRAQPDEVPPLRALWNAMELLAGSFDASPEAQEHYRLIVAESSVNARAIDLQSVWEDQIATELESRFGGDDHAAEARVVVAFGIGGLRAATRRSITSGLPLLRLLDESLAVLCTATASMCAQNG
jgi:AcrR family transcriptional regulator